MKPKKIWANLGVADVQRTRKFYSEIGFRSNEGEHKTDTITSFLVGDSDFIVHFFRHDALHPAYRESVESLKNTNEIMFTLSAESKEEVMACADEVINAGGTIFSAPAELGGNYYGFGFADPDGHKWNVFYM